VGAPTASSQSDQKEQTEPKDKKEESQKQADEEISRSLSRTVVTGMLMLFVLLFALHSTWVTSHMYSSPSVVLASSVLYTNYRWQTSYSDCEWGWLVELFCHLILESRWQPCNHG
jgi:hypothetical protein